MKDFGLVVIGAHFGVWLSDVITKNKNKNILLVEPVPYNYKILYNKFKDNKNISICTKAIFSKNQKKIRPKMFKKQQFFLDLTHSSIYLDYYKFI